MGSPFIPGCLLWRHALPAPAPVLAIAALAMGIPLWYADLPSGDASKIQQPRRAKLVWSITSAMTPLRGDGAKYEAQPKRGCDCREIVRSSECKSLHSMQYTRGRLGDQSGWGSLV